MQSPVTDPITGGKGACERCTVGRQRLPGCCLDMEGREEEAEVTLRTRISGGNRKGAKTGGSHHYVHTTQSRPAHPILPSQPCD